MRLWKCDRCGQDIAMEEHVCRVEGMRKHDTEPNVELCVYCFGQLQRFLASQYTGGRP